MKKELFILIAAMPLLTFARDYKRHYVQKGKLSIQLSEGILNIIPLSAKVIRIQWKTIPFTWTGSAVRSRNEPSRLTRA
jgi:hypothetical protein